MVSVIIPSYNREKTIIRAINSVLNQTYQDIEIIIVDDNSSDNTESVIKNLNNPLIHYYKLKENKGACFARNYGIEKARGKYIAFQDSDDYWLENKLENQIKFLEDNNADAVFCQFELYNEEKNTLIKVTPRSELKEGQVDFNTIINKSLIGTPTLLIKKECFDKVKFDFSLPRLQDWDFGIRLCKEYKVFYQKKVYLKAYVQNNSISKNYEKGLKALEIISKKYEKELKNNKKANSNILLLLADYNKHLNGKYIHLIAKALKTNFSLKNILRGLKIVIK